MILAKSVRVKVNDCLKSAIVNARRANGLSINCAAEALGLSESELIAIEENPVLISSITLQFIMKEYGCLSEFLDAVNISTAIIIQGSRNDST